MPKPSACIQIIDGGKLRLQDRKLFNVLLAESWERMFEQSYRGPFLAPAKVLREAMGQMTERGDDEFDGDLLDVDTIFGHPFKELCAGQEAFLPGSTAVLSDEPITQALAAPSYRFACDVGLLLLDPDGVAVGG